MGVCIHVIVMYLGAIGVWPCICHGDGKGEMLDVEILVLKSATVY